MSKAVFPETTGNESQKPQDGGTRSASDIRNALSALFQGDFAPLRARAQDTPDMTVKVNAAVIQGYFAQVNASGQPVSFFGGNSSAVSAPSSNPRIDILYLNPSTSSLGWVTGTESASPAADWSGLPEEAIPICLVYCKTTMTKIVNYEDKDANPNDGYIYQDVRPVIGGGGGADRLIKSADGNTSVDTEASAGENKIRFKTAGSERAVIDNNGNVGIGTNPNPSAKLDVNGDVYFGTYSKSTNGYTKLPNGLILQWGYTSPSKTNVTLPVTFPNEGLVVLVTNASSQGSGVDNAFGYFVNNSTIYVATKAEDFGGGGAISNHSVYWLAIGY